MTRLFFLHIAFMIVSVSLYGQKENKYLRQGNSAFNQKAFEDADLSYRKALELNNSSFEGYFNLGNALYKKEQFSDAEVKFNRALELAKTKGDKAMTYYNMGNALLKQNKLKESIEAYKNSLRSYPGDAHAIYNLSYAMQKLKEQQDGQQNQDEKKENDEENKDQEENKKDESKEGEGENKDEKNKKPDEGKENEDEEKKGNEGKNEKDKSGDNKESQPSPNNVNISPDDAKKLLEALEGEEKKVQAKILEKKGKGQKTKAEKEW